MWPARFGRNVVVWALLTVVFLLINACGVGAAKNDGVPKQRTSAEHTARRASSVNLIACGTTEPSVLEQDARSYAKDEGIALEEARRRLILHHCLMDDVAELEYSLKNGEADTFAGLYGQGYGYIVLFTRDGEETIRPYLEDQPERLGQLIEVRSGMDATAAELAAARKETTQVLDQLETEPASATNVKKNRVEIYVRNESRFGASLREAGLQLSKHVIAVESELCCLSPG